MLTDKNLFIILLLSGSLLLLCNKIFGQDRQRLTRLLTALDAPNEDSKKLDALENIAQYYSGYNSIEAITYYQKAAHLANELRLKNREAYLYFMLGNNYQVQGSFSSSLSALAISAGKYQQENEGHSKAIADVYIEMANVFVITGMFDKAGTWLDSAGRILEPTHDYEREARIYNLRGTMYDNVFPYDSALYFYNLQLAMARKAKNAKLEMSAFLNIANTYKSQKNINSALLYDDQVLQYEKAANTLTPENFAQLYCAIADTWVQAGNYQNALTNYNKSLSLARQVGQKGIECSNYAGLTKMYAALGNYKMQNHYLTLYYVLKDSLTGADIKNKLIQTEADYELEKKNDLLLKTVKEENTKILERNLLIGFVCILMLLSSYILWLQQKKFRQRQQLKNLLLDKHKAKLCFVTMQMQQLAKSIAEKNDLIRILKQHASIVDEKTVFEYLQHSKLLTNSDWNKFKVLFEQVHYDYLKSLHAKIPDISLAEERLMALAKLNFSKKEMAATLGVSPESIRVTWHRLRKRLNITNDVTIEALVATVTIQ